MGWEIILEGKALPTLIRSRNGVSGASGETPGGNTSVKGGTDREAAWTLLIMLASLLGLTLELREYLEKSWVNC